METVNENRHKIFSGEKAYEQIHRCNVCHFAIASHSQNGRCKGEDRLKILSWFYKIILIILSSYSASRKYNYT